MGRAVGRKRTRAGALAAALVALCVSGAASAAGLSVPLDQAKPLRLNAPVAGVVVGNPAIIGVTLQSDRLLFVTGRAYGSTNLIVVDGSGRPLFESRVSVVPDVSGGVVMVTKGVETVRHECAPLCRSTPDLSDDPKAFGQIQQQITARAGAAGN